jgi:Zn-dependent M28 family amino/carboxypeptidase
MRDPEPDPETLALADRLRADVEALASSIGERNVYRPGSLDLAATHVERGFAATGLATRRLPVEVPDDPKFRCRPQTVWNVEAEKPGDDLAAEVLVVGAHYDSKVATPRWYRSGPPLPERPGSPGGNDNATGVAALLALAGRLAHVRTRRTVRFVAFPNEEPPFFQTAAMGSRVYARSCARDPAARVVAMIAVDTIGCFSRRPRRKRIPLSSLIGLPDRPDYVAFMGNAASWGLARRSASVFNRASDLRARAVVLPAVSRLVAWSDDWSFWQEGVPAFTATDTAFQRSDDYHEPTDTADRVEPVPMAHVVLGLAAVVQALANAH